MVSCWSNSTTCYSMLRILTRTGSSHAALSDLGSKMISDDLYYHVSDSTRDLCSCCAFCITGNFKKVAIE